jgi:hypothetical protein
MPRKTWVYDPHSGGRAIPKASQAKIRQRILAHASRHYAGKYKQVDVRFRWHFCYIDSYKEPFVAEDYNPEWFGESREEHIERLRNTPIHLCRLRYFGNEDRWSMAFYTYSNEKHEPCTFGNGS